MHGISLRSGSRATVGMFFSVHVKVKMLAPNRRVHGRAWQAIRAYCFFPYTLTFWATI